MDENARRYTRRILLIHLLLLLVVLAVVALAAHEVVQRTREQVTAQAQSRQSLLANQTARGIESQYQSILNNLDLLRRADMEEASATQPTRTIDRILGMNLSNLFGGNNGRSGIVGVVLWKQLEGRLSLLFSVDRATLNHGNPNVHVIGSAAGSPAVNDVVAKSKAWIETVEVPSISKFQQFGEQSGNLICVPHPNGRMLVALIPIQEIEATFLRSLNEDAETGAWLVDSTGTVMAASRPNLAGLEMADLADVELRNLATDFSTNHRSCTDFVLRPFTIGQQKFAPSMVTAEPITIGERHWELFIASSMNQVDGIVYRLFNRALIWGVIGVLAITGILVSTALTMIKSRVRVERVRHELLTKELGQAREIQLAWLPETKPAHDSIDIAAINSPASHISGDFYNWFSLPDGRLVVTIGDVTGHGMSAAFLMATTQLLIRNTMPSVSDPGACLEEVNRQLCVQVFNGQFVTLLIMIIDLEESVLHVATAGHPAPLLADGESFQPLPIEPQLVLGVERDTKFITETFKLPPTSSLLLYTDGVVECPSMDGAYFGNDGLQRSLYGRYDSAQSMLNRVINSVNDFRGPRELTDDLTLVAVQMQASPASPNLATAAI